MTYPDAGAVAPKKRLGTGAIIAIVIGAVVVIVCCGLGAVALIAGDKKPNTAASSPSALATSPTATAPGVVVSPSPSPSPSPTPATVKMPNLVGQNAAVAADELKKLGFTRIQFGSLDANDKVVLLPANWTVKKQSAQAETLVATDTLIVLSVSKQ
jgi:hypothetical protein